MERLRLRVGCEFVLDADAPVPTLMLVRAHPDQEHHTLYESHWLRPDVPLHEYVDLFGNRCWRFTVPTGELTVRYDAVVETDRGAGPGAPGRAPGRGGEPPGPNAAVHLAGHACSPIS